MRVKKILSFVLALALCASMLVFLPVGSAGAQTAPALSIDYCNLSFRENVCIKYAVKSEVENVRLLVWTKPAAEYLYETADAQITASYPDTIGGEQYRIFDYTELTAKQMGDVVYARAYAIVDGEAVYSSVNKYSILQYAYNMLGKTATESEDEELKSMLRAMLLYGAEAQKYLDDYKVDRLVTADWVQVKLTAGKLDDGCTHGLYLPGDTVTLTAPATNADGLAFTYWEDILGNRVADTTSFTLTVGEKNNIYKPVYVKYANGLTFDSNGDGTCVVLDMGDCSDTAVVIPPVSPEGDTVIAIETSAFAGTDIVSVSIPATVKEIGRRAFNGCESLTDVYYESTEANWASVTIGQNNDPLLNATMHFYVPVLEAIPIYTYEDLLAIPSGTTDRYVLENDLNLNGEVISYALAEFAGEFNGAGHKIYNFLYQAATATDAFFVNNKGTIKNLSLEGFTFSGTYSTDATVGVLVSTNNGTVENCHVGKMTLIYSAGLYYGQGDTGTSYFGGLVGRNNGKIKDCSVSGECDLSYSNTGSDGWYNYSSGALVAGGIAAQNAESGIINGGKAELSMTVYAGCSVDRRPGSNNYCTKSMTAYIGGGVGVNNGTVQACAVTAEISVSSGGNCDRMGFVGGLVSENRGSIEASLANAEITAAGGFTAVRAGGFVDRNYGQIDHCYAEVSMTLSDNSCCEVGGFVSLNSTGGSVSHSYAVGTISSTVTSTSMVWPGGFVGKNAGGAISSAFCSVNISLARSNSDKVGAFCAIVENGGSTFNTHYDSTAEILLGGAAYTAADATAKATDLSILKTAEFIFDTLYWDAEVWSVTDGALPTLICMK